MAIPRELLDLYKGLSPKETFYLKARWLVSPIGTIERALPEKGRIYDIGCGAGLLSNAAAIRSRERSVFGIDISAEKISIAERSVGDRKNVAFRAADAAKADLERPDVVVMCDLLHHIPPDAQKTLIGHIRDSLGAGGILIVQDIDRKPFYKYILARATDMILSGGERHYYRASREWEAMLRDTGFDVETISLHKGYPIAATMFKCVKR
jgi:2-polyprenyl-3-methyl-5-hydroxy-6-metoxy-1,4-benzoquinol methylase